MIAKTNTTKSIGGLASYLSFGKAANKNKVDNREERVAWESGRNLRGADSIETARRRFRRVAAHKARQVEAPLYQIIISWQSGNEKEGIPPDNPSREEMEWAIDEVLSELGLEEHQAWIVAHRDTSTPHIHTVVNRVHPRSAETWEPPSYDKTVLYHTLRRLEEKKDWHRPGPMNIEDLPDDRRRGLEYWEEEAEKFGRERSVRRWAREEGIADLLKRATSWEQAEKILIGTEARLKPRRENGMVLARGDGHAALSAIDPEISRPNLEDRYGQTWDAYSQKRGALSDRLLETVDGDFFPTKKQLKAYRLVEKIEAIRQVAETSEKEEPFKGTLDLNPQQEKAQAALVGLVDHFRKTPPEREEGLRALQNELGGSGGKILETARTQGPQWALGMTPAGQEKMASGEEPEGEEAPVKALKDADISMSEYVRRRIGAPAQMASRLDEMVSCKRLRLHQDALTRRLNELQQESLRASWEAGSKTQALSEATGRLKEALGREDGEAARSAYEEMKERFRKRRQIEQTFRGDLPGQRRALFRELEETGQILAERRGGASEEDLDLHYRQTGRRAYVLREWRRRLGEQQSVDETAREVLKTYTQKAHSLEKAPTEDHLKKLRQAMDRSLNRGDRAEEVSELESKALQRLHSIEAAVEETDIHLSGNQSDKIWPEGILPEEEASPDPDTSLEGNTPLEEKPQKQRRELGKRAVVHKGPAPVELRSSSKLKEDLRQLASRRRSNRKELLAKIRHVRKENTALKAQVSRLRKAAKKQQEIRRQETTQSEEIGQLSGSPSLLSVVEARIEKRRALKAEVEKEIAEDRSLIQAQESEISKIEDTLAERGERDSGLPHPQRLEEKGQVLGRLQDLELQRREIAIAQADVLGMAQEEMGDQDRPERFDPSRQRESLEQLARRAKDAADQFRQKTEAVAEKARRTRDSEETITGSVERSQMRADLREIAQAEKNAREAFEKVFEKGPEARRQFAKEAHLEGVDERTWSYDRAHWQLATHPEEYGELTGPDVEDEGPNVGDEGPKSRALEAARAQQAVDKKRRAFRRTYDGRRPTRAAEDLLPDGDEARRVLPEMPTGRALSPEARKAAAEDAKATAKNRIERWEEKFLENAQRKFTDKDQALQSFRENERICDVEVARGVLLEPSAYRDEEGSRLQDPGREWWSRERSKNRMKELGRKIQKQERRVRTLDQAANTAMIQQLEKRLQDGRVVVDPENRAPAPKQTTLSRVALRGVSGRDLPYVENDLYAEDDSPFDSAWEAFRGQIQDRRPSEKGWEATPIVKEARRTERCKAIRRDLDAAWSNDTSLQDQKRVLLGTLGRQGMELESAKNVLRQVEKGQEAAEAIRQVVGPQPAESDAPESVREAAETIASLDRESEKGRATRLIEEGVQTKNGVLREAGKLELIRSLHRSHSEEEDRRDEKIISRAAKLRERVGEWEARSPEAEDYDLRLKEHLREMTEREQTLLERRASSDERVQEAVERAQSPGCVENQRRTTEKRRRSAGRTQSLPTEDNSRTTGTQSKRSQNQTDDNSQKKDQDENQQTTERQRDRGRGGPDRGRGGIGF